MADIEKLNDALAKIEGAMDDTHGRLAKSIKEQEDQIRELGGTSTATLAEIKELSKRYDQEMADAKGLVDTLSKELVEIKEAQKELESKSDREWQDYKGKEDLADYFVKSKEWQEFNPLRDTNLRVALPGGFENFSTNLEGKHFSRNGSEKKDITVGLADLRDVLARNTWTQIFGLNQVYEDRLRDFMTIEPATGDVYHYMEKTKFENNAAFQAAEGALKANSDWEFAPRSAGPHVIAHGTTVSRQQARQLPAIINVMRTDLIEGIYDAETRALLFGDGSDGGFKGIMNHERIQYYNETGKVTDTPIDVLRRSEDPLKDVQLRGDLYVMNHRDWTNIELLKDNEERYLWVQVQIGGQARMWRKPVLATAFMPEGQFINGGFREYARILDYERANLRMYDQHKDYAQRNLLYFLAEEEIGLAITTPQGFVVGNLDGSPSGSGS